MLYLSFRDCIGESLAFWFVLTELFVFGAVVVVGSGGGGGGGGGFCRFCGGSSICPRFDTVFLPCASMCKNHAAL
jgi:hypothetical protein